MQISILLNLFMSKTWDSDYAPRQPYIYPDNLKYISLTYNTTHKHTYVNVIGTIIYINRFGKKGDWKRECVVYGRHKYFPIGILSERERNLYLKPRLS